MIPKTISEVSKVTLMAFVLPFLFHCKVLGKRHIAITQHNKKTLKTAIVFRTEEQLLEEHKLLK